MTKYIALLRGVNVGGNALVAMADLREMVAELGFGDVRSQLQSGNLVFSGAARATAPLERRLQEQTFARLGLRTEFMVRTAAEWADVVARNPYADEAKRDPGHLLVMFLKTAPAAPAVRALAASIAGREAVRAGGRHLYITYPDGLGRSKFTGARIERALGTTGTMRNWNTVRKLEALAG